MSQYSYPKEEHLKSRKAIKYLFDEGKKKMIFPILFQYGIRDKRTEADPNAVYGVTVSKKKAKKAAQRNKVKRQMREAYRLYPYEHLDLSPRQLCVMAVYVGNLPTDYTAITRATEEFKKWIDKKYKTL